jgi:hypothetical protein
MSFIIHICVCFIVLFLAIIGYVHLLTKSNQILVNLPRTCWNFVRVVNVCDWVCSSKSCALWMNGRVRVNGGSARHARAHVCVRVAYTHTPMLIYQSMGECVIGNRYTLSRAHCTFTNNVVYDCTKLPAQHNQLHSCTINQSCLRVCRAMVPSSVR